MEKIITAVKELIHPVEKEWNHLDSHVQINKLFKLILDELKILHKKHDENVEIVEKANANAENITKKMDNVKDWINKVISNEVKKLTDHIELKTTKDSQIIPYKWIVSTESEIIQKLDPIHTKLKDKYRIEVSKIRMSRGNEDVLFVELPNVDIFEWENIPKIHLKSKGWLATYEYDFDILVTKI